MAGAGRGGKTAPFGNQEAISNNTQTSVMMKSAPAASFKVPQSEFLFQFLVIAFDDPAVFGEIDQITERRVSRQRGEPVFCGLLFLRGPFDEEPFFRMRLGAPVVSVGGADTNGSEPGNELVLYALPPGNALPLLRVGSDNASSFCAYRLMLRISSQRSFGGRPSSFLRSAAGFGC